MDSIVRSCLKAPRANQLENHSVIVIAETKTPTCQVYFSNRHNEFAQYFQIDAQDPNIRQLLSEQLTENHIVVYVRHIDISSYKYIRKYYQNISIVYFVDDDIPSITHDATIPPTYKKKTLKRWKSYQKYIRDCAIWVSTPYLASKYNLGIDSVLSATFIDKPNTKLVTYCYHGSAVHTKEIEFVCQLVEQIQEKHVNTVFEIIGDITIKKQFKHIPRVRVIHPMSWEQYLYHTSITAIDIVLAPLFPSPFNDARSHTKLLDAKRMGAYTLASTHYKELITHPDFSDVLSIVEDNHLSTWLKAFETRLQKVSGE